MLTVPYTHTLNIGGSVISVRIQNSEAAEECFLMVFLSSGILLVFSVAHGPKTLCKENRKLRAAVPVACVCVCFQWCWGQSVFHPGLHITRPTVYR